MGDVGHPQTELDGGDGVVTCRVNLDRGVPECAVGVPWVGWLFDQKEVNAQRRVEGERTVNVSNKQGEFKQTGFIHPGMVSSGTDILWR